MWSCNAITVLLSTTIVSVANADANVIGPCNQPDTPNHGDRTHSVSWTVGSEVRYWCNCGYTLHGSASAKCIEDHHKTRWSDPAPSCIDSLLFPSKNHAVRPRGNTESGCSMLIDPKSGHVQIRKQKGIFVAEYKCNSGYRLSGNQRRDCVPIEWCWTGRDPTCEPEGPKCRSLKDPSNGVVRTNGFQRVGSIATYSCNEGYALVGGGIRKCQSNTQWSGSEPSCQRIHCRPLMDPTHGAVSFSSTDFQSVATYSCNEGYRLTAGEKRRVCQKSGMWNGTEPQCTPVVCGSLSSPNSGTVILNGTIFGAVARYDCNSGFTLVGQQIRTCQKNGVWSGATPHCKALECRPLDNPPNGLVNVTGSAIGSFATYSCDKGFTLVGVGVRKCQPNRQWSETEPFCQRLLECGILNNPSHGGMSATGLIEGSTATYFCNIGYKLFGSTFRVCQPNGQWSESEPSCQIECGPLGDPTHGIVSFSSTGLQHVATYSCNEGYRLTAGEKQRVCQKSGVWSGAEPQCTVVDCGPLGYPVNGDILILGTSLNNNATFFCDDGYYLEGSKVRVCLANGTWSGTPTSCKLADCGPADAPENGAALFNSTTYLSVARYVCNKGYELFGDESATCESTGWSAPPPVCKTNITCPLLKRPKNGVVYFPEGLYQGSVAMHTCNVGYILEGDGKRFCLDNSTWSGTSPSCVAIDCGSPPMLPNGSVSYTHTSLGSLSHYACNNGYARLGSSVRVCNSSGGWSGDTTSCVSAVSCGPLGTPAGGTIYITGRTVGSAAAYTCNPKLFLLGERVRVCQGDGHWSGSEPKCLSLIDGCDDPGMLENGRRFGDKLTVGSVLHFHCFQGYTLVGSKYRVCQENGMFSGTQPICVPSNDSCFDESDVVDSCEQRCQCINGRFANCCRIRYDYHRLTTSERLTYISAVKEVATNIAYKARYNKLMANYSASYKNHVTQSIDPSVSQFFPYIRYFLLEYENLLREVDCRVTIPFWDWTGFHDVPYESPVWDNEQGFGRTSDQSTNMCVTTGPFRQGEYHVSPEAGGGCIRREYVNATYPSRAVVEKDVLTLPAAQFNTLHRFLQLYFGITIQCLVGGTMFSPNAAEDPAFLLQLSQLDSLFTRWQSFGGGREKVRYANDTNRLLLTPALTVSQMSHSSSLPYGTCVSYSSPVLLKNYAPPPSRPFVGPFADQIATEPHIAAEERSFYRCTSYERLKM